ncbi:hypothetical protein D3C76_1223680 [compost metagenome]
MSTVGTSSPVAKLPILKLYPLSSLPLSNLKVTPRKDIESGAVASAPPVIESVDSSLIFVTLPDTFNLCDIPAADNALLAADST